MRETRSKTISDWIPEINQKKLNSSETDFILLTKLPYEVIQRHMFSYLNDVDFINIGAAASQQMKSIS